MNPLRSFITATLLTAAATLAAADTAATPVPRDTSFTRWSTWLKIKKKNPTARLVPDTLPPGVAVDRDVVYSTIDGSPYMGGKRDLHVDIYRPKGAYSALPALLMIHGGGWNSGDKSLQGPMAAVIASRGYIAIPVEYRLTPEAPYPAGLHDVKTAIRWARANAARLGIDSTRIAIAGCSAGGQLAALAGVTNGSPRHEGNGQWQGHSSSVAAVIDIDGITTFVSDYNLTDAEERFRKKHELPVNAKWLGGMPADARHNWDEASAILWVTPQSAPICFINSDLPRYRDGRDEIIPRLEALGVKTRIFMTGSPIHPFWFFDPWFGPTVDTIVSFLDNTLF